MKKVVVLLIAIAVLTPSLASAQYRDRGRSYTTHRDRDWDRGRNYTTYRSRDWDRGRSYDRHSHGVRIDPGALFLVGAGLVVLDRALDAAIQPRVIVQPVPAYQAPPNYYPQSYQPAYAPPPPRPTSPDCLKFEADGPEVVAQCERGVRERVAAEERAEEQRKAAERARLMREAYEAGRKGK